MTDGVGSALSGAMSGLGGLFGGGGGGMGGGGGGSSPFGGGDGSGFNVNDMFSNLDPSIFNDPTMQQPIATQGPPNQPDPTSAGGGTTSGTTTTTGSQPDSSDPNAGFRNILKNTMAGRGPSTSPAPAADSTAKAFQTGAGAGAPQPLSGAQPASPAGTILTTDNSGNSITPSSPMGPPQQPNAIDTTNLDPRTTPYGGPAMGPRQGLAGPQDPGAVNPAAISGDWYNNLHGVAGGPTAADKPAPGATEAGPATTTPGAAGGYDGQGGYGGQGGQFDVGNLFRAIMPMIMMMAMGGMGRGGMGAMLPMMMMGLLGGGQGGFPGMFRGGHLGRGYYPDGRGGMRFHPGGYHPGWGGRAAGGGGGVTSAPRNGPWSNNPFLSTLVGAESGGRQGPGVRGDGGLAKGYFQFHDQTWQRYARNVPGAEQYTSAEDAPDWLQMKVAMTAPIREWGGLTKQKLHARFGDFNEGMTIGQLSQMFGGGGGDGTAVASADPASSPSSRANRPPAADKSGDDAWKKYLARDRITSEPVVAANQLSSGGMDMGASPAPPPGGMDPNDPGYRDMPMPAKVETRGRDPTVPANARTGYDPRKDYVSPQGRAWAARNMPAAPPTGYLPDPTRSPFIHQGSPETGYWAQTPDGRVIHYPGTATATAAPMS